MFRVCEGMGGGVVGVSVCEAWVSKDREYPRKKKGKQGRGAERGG